MPWSRCKTAALFNMNEEVHILVIDGNPIALEGYKHSIATYGNVETAHNCRDAFQKLESGGIFNLLVTEVTLIPFVDRNIYSGIDLALLIRKNCPGCKIVLLTYSTNDFSYYETIIRVNPEGYIVKGNIHSAEFLYVLRKILDGERFYCGMVKQALWNIKNRGIYFDELNLEIIRLLAKGIKTKNIPKHLPLCISAIDKRKAQIKEIFDIEKGTDEDIIRVAKNNGFI